jgi:serine/threonine-protein kinase
VLSCPSCGAAAHQRGVIHRDLKPANLMIDGEGRIRIADFGIAALSAAGGPAAGTPGYMAPELLAGGPATVRSDIYALGPVLYELFTGKKASVSSSWPLGTRCPPPDSCCS